MEQGLLKQRGAAEGGGGIPGVWCLWAPRMLLLLLLLLWLWL